MLKQCEKKLGKFLNKKKEATPTKPIPMGCNSRPEFLLVPRKEDNISTIGMSLSLPDRLQSQSLISFKGSTTYFSGLGFEPFESERSCNQMDISVREPRKETMEKVSQKSPGTTIDETAPCVQSSNSFSGEMLKVHDRVVWLLKNTTYMGRVEWVGEIGGDLKAGVNFERDIGNSDGIFKGTRYFQCEERHGGFLPVCALIKYDDFFGSEGLNGCDERKDNYSTRTTRTNGHSFSDTSSDNHIEGDSFGGQNNRIMTEKDDVIICVICQQSLMASMIENSENNCRSSEGMLSTSCGHLFHASCLNKWFYSKSDDFIQECPYCKRKLSANSTIRIFPVLGQP